MEKPETTLLRCSLLIEGILGMGEVVVVIIGCDGWTTFVTSLEFCSCPLKT